MLHAYSEHTNCSTCPALLCPALRLFTCCQLPVLGCLASPQQHQVSLRVAYVSIGVQRRLPAVAATVPQDICFCCTCKLQLRKRQLQPELPQQHALVYAVVYACVGVQAGSSQFGHAQLQAALCDGVLQHAESAVLLAVLGYLQAPGSLATPRCTLLCATAA
ncbi:hypothetical protein COO60DRAFT_682007 [Scenedesmus sp. NREL 46B-D3]|nr:hypothetical protein COO60DRAFT_682007 [Scenedesmus sp. NREL 46B-D3]